jgi:CheY-like chemotaxis protein
MSRVLMIDDAGIFQMLEGSFLRRVGCEIVRVDDGRAVLEKARQSPPDLIVIDSERPGLDGTECLRALKTDPALQAIPVLVLTLPERVPLCCDAGADATLARPVASGALELALCLLGRVSHREEPRRSVRVPVQVASPVGAVRCRVKDISRTGLFLSLAEPLPLHVEVSLSLRLPSPAGLRSVHARGEIVRQVARDPESHLIAGVGVRFVEIDPRTEGLIDHYVKEGVVDAEPRGAGDLEDRERP